MYFIDKYLLPKNTKRRMIAKMLYKGVSHPRILFSYINADHLRRIYGYINQHSYVETINKITSILCKFESSDIDTYIEIEQPKEILSLNECTKLRFKEETAPLVSIIIPVYNQFTYTYYCLKSILNNTDDIKYEIILADDSSNDITKGIKQITENVTIIRNDTNLRFLKNCNNAAKSARGKYVLFLNNDTQVQKNWLSPLVELMEKDKTIGLVGSKFIYPNGVLQEAGGIIWKNGSGCNYGRNQDPKLPEFNYVKDVDYISGASIMLTNSLWKEIGGFDERFVPAYYEDADLAFEVRNRGLRVVFQPKSKVVHFEGISNGTDVSEGQKKYQVDNKEKFLEKWNTVLNSEEYCNEEDMFVARDRSTNKKTIIFIDRYVPRYDQDAGSRTIFQYLKILVKNNYNVKFIGDDYQCDPYRYTEELNQLGIETLYGEFYNDNWEEWLRNNKKYITNVFINRPNIAQKYLYKIKKDNPNAKIIYNVCDVHFIRERKEYETTGEKRILQSAKEWERIEGNIFNNSDVVLTLSADEKAVIEKMTDTTVEIAPIFIFGNFNEDSNDSFIKTQEEKKNIMFIGGFEHKPNEDGVLWFVDYIFQDVLNQFPDIKLILVGSKPTNKIKTLKSKNIIVTGFVTDEELEEIYKSTRLCIIPLRYGGGVKGKTIEAMYNKIPIVSTSIGIEGLPGIEKCIEATDTPSEFANKIKQLYCDYSEQNKMINQNFLYVKSRYSEEVAQNFFRKIIQ